MSENLARKYEQEDLRHYEIWNGQVYYMAGAVPRHNRVMGNIYRIFGNYLEGKRCNVYSETFVRFEDEDTTVEPDVFVVCDPSKEGKRYIEGAPDLIVEVLSPSTKRHDRIAKATLYERQGVKEYWIVDPVGKSIEQYILTDSKFVLSGVYAVYEIWEWDELTERERAECVKEFKTTIFDDLVIDIDKVFD